MSKPPSNLAALSASALLLMVYLTGSIACGGKSETRPPLLIVSGPDDFLSFEVRTENGEAVWRIETNEPTLVPVFVYGTVPEGFLQTVPTSGTPRNLEFGERLLMESQITDRVFLHRGYADSEATIVIQEWGMRRRELSSLQTSRSG